ncbi:class I SAM-dependent methyltransferase [Alteraurantiacibacter aquimixticola]|uniref:Class I SAM-dependent methyltransferase n=1 Tax=Alteraurantiacibacter aquimixticola TaxID=2489173 RepID=A0A4T3F0Z0_9SPHN|nr:class I SAM-dependent methyltransferase [Alteraurantiacibacter aquimixticola]TIX50217.1 class I SAM-dependent methyltransferase [Alteraurantiacibacter aquimixticola]
MAGSDWDLSAQAWIASMGERGDWMREHVLDPAMTKRLSGRGYRKALDVGCGEGRLCRLLGSLGIASIGIDPTARLIEEAVKRDPGGQYQVGSAHDLPFDNASFDLVVSCFSLIDIADYKTAIGQMARVLAPGGVLVIANLNSFVTVPTQDEARERWVYGDDGRRAHFRFDHYLDEAVNHEEWAGIAITNYHRPLSAYMKALIGQGLQLTYFDEPEPVSGEPAKVEKYRRVPYALLMEWQKS